MLSRAALDRRATAALAILCAFRALCCARAAAGGEAGPIILRAGQATQTSVELSLGGAPGEASGIELSRRKHGNAGEWEVVATLPPRKTRHVDSAGVEPGTEYVYRARLVRRTSTRVIRGGEEAKRVAVPVGGASELVLVATDGGDGNGNDHAVWGDAALVRADGSRVPLASLEAKVFKLGYGTRQAVRTRKIGRKDYARSVWTHAPSRLVYHLEGGYERFEAWVGVDRSQGSKGSVSFEVEAVPARARYSAEVTVTTKDWHRSPGRTTYYIDSSSGDDSSRGTSRRSPWRSLARVNATVFAPGDRMLFKAGSRWAGQLKPMGSGREGSPIVVDAYGGHVGYASAVDLTLRGDGKPRIDGEGRFLSTVHLYNIEHFELRNLEITNTGKTRRPKRRGVLVQIENFGTARHIVLSGLHIHDVNGSLVKKEGGGSGIKWQNGGSRKKSRFDGLTIEDCHLVRTDRNGINASGYWPRKDWYPSLNVVIRGNLLEDIGGDGIVPIATDGCLVEHNTIHGGRMRAKDHCAGIWPWSADNTVIQHNEVSGYKGTKDGQGFDSDWNCRNTLFQYNYSHDNEGGFMLVCNNGGSKMPMNIGNINTVIRYNISRNDRTRLLHISGPCKGVEIYNNTFYVGPHLDMHALLAGNWGGGWTESCHFYNNIFHVDGKVRWELKGMKKDIVFSNNAFYGNHVGRPSDPKAITSDPGLQRPGSGAKGFDSLEGYKLKAGSPCIGAGRKIEDNGGRDFWGGKLPAGAPSIGAHEARAARR